MQKPNTPLSARLALALIVSMMATAAKAVTGEEAPQPRLVVGIMVEDLQPEYINLLRQYFSNGGFNRLINNGVVLTNVDYGTYLDPAAASAMIYTGAGPATNGIPSTEIFDRPTMRTRDVFADREFLGNYTEQALSPRALLTSNLTDEIRIASDGVTLAYALAPDAAQSLAMGGHAANCAMWINDANGHWATTTYFKDLPRSFNTRNQMRPLSTRLDSISWTPSMSSSRYMLLPQHLTVSPFVYTFGKKGPQSMQAFKNSPLVNTEITDMAIAHINDQKLGLHDGTDIINIAYTLEPYAFSRNADNRYELLDAYYRLDHDLEKLFHAIDNTIGLPNALVFLASTPQKQHARRDDPKWQIPYGEFSTLKASSLLNLYFVSLYGAGNWVIGYHNNEFFLNHDLIKKHELDLADMRRQAAAFLVQMSGVATAYSLDDILNNRTSMQAAARKLNTNIALAGDVMIHVYPGWELLDDLNNPTVKPNQVAREAAPTGTVYIMAPGLPPNSISTPVDARSIAPTICGLLRIRSPNAATVAPISLEK